MHFHPTNGSTIEFPLQIDSKIVKLHAPDTTVTNDCAVEGFYQPQHQQAHQQNVSIYLEN